MLELDVWALAQMTRAVLSGKRQRRSGSVVNLGKMALETAAAKLQTMRQGFDAWAAVSVAADYPDSAP